MYVITLESTGAQSRIFPKSLTLHFYYIYSVIVVLLIQCLKKKLFYVGIELPGHFNIFYSFTFCQLFYLALTLFFLTATVLLISWKRSHPLYS